MDSRKFFQSYELSSLEEAYVVLKNFIVGFMEMRLGQMVS